MGSDDEHDKIKDQWINSMTDSKGNFFVDKNLAMELINFVQSQISEFTKPGFLNSQEHAHLLKKAHRGVFILCFVKYYDTELLDKEPVWIATNNYLDLCYSLVLNGRYRDIILQEIDSKRQVIVGAR